MKRREFITLIVSVAAWPLAARAQQGERIRRVGVLIGALTEKDSEGQLRMAAFRQGLQSLGWVEGRNIHIEECWPGGNNKRLRSFAAGENSIRPHSYEFGKVACPQHAQAFLVKLVDYLKMKFPMVELHTHVAKRTIEQYRDAAEKVYLEMKPAKVP